MSCVCQVIHCVLAVLTATGAVAAVPAPGPTPAETTQRSVPIEVRAYAPRDFASLLLESPELAAVWALAPRWRGEATAPERLPDAERLGKAVGAALDGIMPIAPLHPSVIVATVDIKALGALFYGSTIVLLTPKTEPWTDGDAARAVATTLLLGAMHEAPPDPRASEPLLTFGESLAAAGSIALAGLPAELRPVREWLEPKDTAAALEALANAALDGRQPWQARRALMTRLARPAGANPAVAQAAALLIEAFGDASRARLSPFDLLLAWKAAGRKSGFPPIPRVLRKALDRPAEAGMPEGKETHDDLAAVTSDALERAIETGRPPAEADARISVAQRMLGVAIARASGHASPCAWLKGVALPKGLRTGCRTADESGGLLYTRPTPDGGADIVSRSPGGDEGVLLRWPRLALFPVIDPQHDALNFIDDRGIWAVDLESGAAPTPVVSGSFRFLAVSPDGTALATVRWPTGTVSLYGGSTLRDSAVVGRGGIAWIEPDILAASDGENLTLLSSTGQSRPWPSHAVHCCRFLTATEGALLAGTAPPCESGLVRLALNDGSVARLVALDQAPLGAVPQPGGGLAFSAAGELFYWNGSGSAERIGAGLTPGPG